MAFLRILLIFALLYFAARLVGRLLFPPRTGRNSQRDTFNRGRKEREGDVTVEDRNPHKKKINKDEGDYIDYEEVKE
ncbi:MAG: hypothetical protein ACP5E3_15970 [Bacteroidales bacterium]